MFSMTKGKDTAKEGSVAGFVVAIIIIINIIIINCFQILIMYGCSSHIYCVLNNNCSLLFGYHLDIIWISFEYYLDIIWILFGYYLDIIYKAQRNAAT